LQLRFSESAVCAISGSEVSEVDVVRREPVVKGAQLGIGSSFTADAFIVTLFQFGALRTADSLCRH
jgi:hypothetical protein